MENSDLTDQILALWLSGKDTTDIALALQVKESIVYNLLAAIMD